MIADFINDLPPIDKTESLKHIIKAIESNRWDIARQLWIVDIMKLKKKSINGTLSIFGGTDEMFVDHIVIFQKHRKIIYCSNNCPNNDSELEGDLFHIFLTKQNDNISIDFGKTKEKCTVCKSSIKFDFRFAFRTHLIFCDFISQNVVLAEVPKELLIDRRKYRLMCAVLHIRKNAHFVAVFTFEDNYYAVNDLDQTVAIMNPLNNKRQELVDPIYLFPVVNAVYILI